MRELLFKCIAVVSAAIDQTGSLIKAENLFRIGAQAVVTGTSTGTLKLQYSNDIIVANPPTPVNWSDIAGATVAIAGAGVYSIVPVEICYEYVRAVFVHGNSAAGTITVNAKALGG